MRRSSHEVSSTVLLVVAVHRLAGCRFGGGAAFLLDGNLTRQVAHLLAGTASWRNFQGVSVWLLVRASG